MLWLIIVFIGLVIIGSVLGGNYETEKRKEISEVIKDNLFTIENFTVSKKIDGFKGIYIFAVDEINQKIALVTLSSKHVVSFSDIIGVELIEDGNIISKKSTTRIIGGAIIGGVFAGGVGTIVGGLSGNSTQKSKVSSLFVKILLRSIHKPVLLVPCFDSKAMTTGHKISLETDGSLESYIYKTGKKNADDIKNLVSVIIDRTDSNKNETMDKNIVTKSSNSIADEIMKLNELREKGILTEQEFTIQKNKILIRE